MELVIGSNHMQDVQGITAEYPYVLNRVNSADIRVPWHWHEEVEFSYVRRGTLRVTISGHRQVFHAGEGFFLNTNILHTMESASETEEVVWDSHMMHPVLLGGHAKSVFDTKYMAPVLKNRKFELAAFRNDNDNQKAILKLLQDVAEVQISQNREFRTRNLFSEIWLLLIRELEDLEYHAKLPKPVSQERIQIMLEYIHQHYWEKITLDQIAAAAIVSKRECLRCFQSCIQKTPVEYLVDYRIQMAERLLRTTRSSVTDIAMQTGFSDGAYFSKIFRQLRGLTPSQYRKEHGSTEHPNGVE